MRFARLTLACLLFVPPGASAASGPQWTAQQLADFAEIIVVGTVSSLTPAWDAQVNAIYTHVTIDVGETLKGSVSTNRITIKQLGGVAGTIGLAINDQATFTVGEEVLLYLEARPRDGTLYTSALWQGKWALRRGANGRRVALRAGPGGHPSSLEIQSLSEARRVAAQSVVGRTLPHAASDSAVQPQGRSSAPFNLLGPYRFLHSPVVDVQSGGQPGLAGGGTTEVRAAIHRWNAAGSSFRFAFGGNSSSSRCSGQFLNNGRVTITFMDPCGEMSNDGGTLALGGSYYLADEGGSADGQRLGRAIEGFIVNNDSPIALRYLTNPGCFEDIQTHELGHVLGLDHSSDPTAVMYATIDSAQCWNGARRLAADDVQGLRFIYGTNVSMESGPPTAAPTDVRVVTSANRLTVSWSDGSPSVPVTSYRVDFRAGHHEGGPTVASMAHVGRTLDVAIPAGTTGAYNVVVAALNAAGAGPGSARVDFSLGDATCAVSPPPPADLRGVVRDGFARVQWSAVPGATRYVIQAGTAPGAADLLPPTDLGSATDTGAAVPAGFRAWVRVFAVNACGAGAPADALIY